MTSLPAPIARALGRRDPSGGGSDEGGEDAGSRRPLVATAVIGGAGAALGPLVVAMVIALIGWFLNDAGGEGAPSGALRVGAFGWLLAHGSGISVEGARITAIPLGFTLLVAWAIWRTGHRVGEAVSGHGPDVRGLSDGARDLTVPLVGGLFTMAYAVVAVLVSSLTSTIGTSPSTPRVVAASLALCLVVGVPAIARGSGRAAVWVGGLPLGVRIVARLVRTLLTWWLWFATAVLAIAFVVDFSTAANLTSQLHVGTGDLVLLLVVSLAVVPNAALFSSSYLLGPGFAVGGGTAVSPTLVILGPLPMFPLLAALPDGGPVPGWVPWLLVTPVLVAFAAGARIHHLCPAAGLQEAAIRGCAGGILGGLVLGVATRVSGGAVGPGRMRHVGPDTAGVLLSSMAAFGIAALLGALVMTWWQQGGREQAHALRERLPFGR
ncbi:cell division protein PerM [Nocardioides montaniterrae]